MELAKGRPERPNIRWCKAFLELPPYHGRGRASYQDGHRTISGALMLVTVGDPDT